MTRRLLLGWILCLLACAAMSAGDDAVKTDDAVKKELEQLKGAWKLIKLEAAGVASNPKFMEKLTFTIGDDTFTLSDGELNSTTKFTLNVTAAPKHVDITPQEGPQKDKPVPGIYELNGDVLKICFARDGQRPAAFATKAGDASVLMEMKKQPVK